MEEPVVGKFKPDFEKKPEFDEKIKSFSKKIKEKSLRKGFG